MQQLLHQQSSLGESEQVCHNSIMGPLVWSQLFDLSGEYVSISVHSYSAILSASNGCILRKLADSLRISQVVCQCFAGFLGQYITGSPTL